MPTKQELEQLIAESRAKAEQDKLDSAKLAEDNKLLQQQLDEIKAYEEMPPQAPPVNATQLDRVVAVIDKVNTKVDGKASAGLKVSDGNGNVDISTMDGSTHAKTLSSVQLVSNELAARKFKRADGSVIGFTDINASGNPAVTAATVDYVDAKAPSKQLVVVFNDGSTETFKVG